MTLEDRIALAVQAVGAKFQRAYAYIGVLGSLNTEIKTDIVSAINNLLTLEGTIIIDKDGRIAALKNDLINGAASEYDTLQELYAAILANTSGLTSVLNDVANLVRYDAAQTLTDGQKTTARNNIGAVREGSLGVIDRDYRAFFLGILYNRAVYWRIRAVADSWVLAYPYVWGVSEIEMYESLDHTGLNVVLNCMVSTDAPHPDYPIQNCVDGNLNTQMATSSSGGYHWIKFKLLNPAKIKSFMIRPVLYGGTPHAQHFARTFVLESSNNDIDWNLVYTGTIPNIINSVQNFYFDNIP